MILIPSKREDGTLVFKTCVYGPSESGRKTVLAWIYEKILASGKLNEIKDEKGSMLSVDLSLVKASNVIFQVYTFDASDESNARIFLKGADAILFIWDSLIEKWKNNLSSLKELLKFYGDKLIPPALFDPPEVPIVVLANKRDLEDIVEISKLRQVLNTAKLNHCLIYETIAITGVNIKRAFVYAARQAVLNHFKKLSGKSMKVSLLSDRKKKANETIKSLSEVYKSIKISEISSRINIDYQETVNLIEDLIKNSEINAYIEGESLVFIKAPLLDLELEREREIIETMDIIDTVRRSYKEFTPKETAEMLETIEGLLEYYVQKFEYSKTAMNLSQIMLEAKNYDEKSTKDVMSYQKYQMLLMEIISKLKNLIPLLGDRAEKI